MWCTFFEESSTCGNDHCAWYYKKTWETSVRRAHKTILLIDWLIFSNLAKQFFANIWFIMYSFNGSGLVWDSEGTIANDRQIHTYFIHPRGKFKMCQCDKKTKQSDLTGRLTDDSGINCKVIQLPQSIWNHLHFTVSGISSVWVEYFHEVMMKNH